MALYTASDINVRLSLMSSYIADYAYLLMGRIKRGAKVYCELNNLYYLIDAYEIASCYDLIDDEDDEQCCLTEAQMDHIFEQVQCITDLCFPPKGLTGIVDTTECYIALETSTNDVVLLEDGSGGLLQEICSD